MRAILEELVSKLEMEIPEAEDWTIKPQRPVWTDEHSGRVLYVYLLRDSPATGEASWRWTGSFHIAYTFALEFVEPADLEAGQLSKGEEVELSLWDIRSLLVTWANSHQLLDNAWRFDYSGTEYENVRRPLNLQGFTSLVTAYEVNPYG